MTTNWKLSQDGISASRTLDSGATESRLMSAIPAGELATALSADPVDTAAEKDAVLKQMRTLRAEVLNALAGIAGRAQRAGDAATAAACDAASTALLDVTKNNAVIIAADGQSTTLAVLACYKAAATALAGVSPSSINAFDALELTL